MYSSALRSRIGEEESDEEDESANRRIGEEDSGFVPVLSANRRRRRSRCNDEEDESAKRKKKKSKTAVAELFFSFFFGRIGEEEEEAWKRKKRRGPFFLIRALSNTPHKNPQIPCYDGEVAVPPHQNPQIPRRRRETKSQRNRSPTKSVFTATFIAPNQLFIFIAPNQLLIFTATFIATYIPTISCLSDRLVSVSSLLSTLVSLSLARPVAPVTPSLSGHRPQISNPRQISRLSLLLSTLSLVFPSLAQPVTPVSLVSLESPSLSGHIPPNPQPQTSRPRTPLLPGCGEDGIPQFDREEQCLSTIFEGQRHQFSFDKVFNPEESQEEVFAEISQLVQNVVDGHKVLDLRTLTWSRVEAKAAVDSVEPSSLVPLAACAGHSLVHLRTIRYHGEISFSLFFGHTKDHQNNHEFRSVIYLKAFDPLAYTWSILKTYGKAPSVALSVGFVAIENATTDYTRSRNDRGAAVHNPPDTSLVQAGFKVADEAQVQVELVFPTSETLLEDTLSTLTDTSDRATTEERQTREFQRHYPKKFHGVLTLRWQMDSHVKTHDVPAISAQIQLSKASTPLVREVDAWWHTTEVSIGNSL
ncbi:hypothetical protein Syun_001109 [Stephania yunnanensis]|uniref:Spindle pole body-associated protein Vik1/Cik1 microtubule binding domain-containing protein n=1 Tax=Stephania yunnanensis TaxID=152371 RepID=A0AAP0Q7F0_9MAGN